MLNVNAKEFVPIEITIMFDKLEREFEINNDWLFNYDFKETEKVRNIDLGKYYYGIKEDIKQQDTTKTEKFLPKLRTIKEEITYADILRNK